MLSTTSRMNVGGVGKVSVSSFECWARHGLRTDDEVAKQEEDTGSGGTGMGRD
jgi:hypothetical protein